MSRISRRAHGRAAIAFLAAVATALTGSVAVANTAVAQPNVAPASIPGDLYDNPFSGITVDIPSRDMTLVPVLTDGESAQVLNFYNQDQIGGTPGSEDYVEAGATPVISVGVVDSLIGVMFAAVTQLVSGEDGTTFVPVAETTDEGETTISFYDADEVEDGVPNEGATVVATYTVQDGTDGNSVTVDEEDGTVTISVVDANDNVIESVTLNDGITYFPVITETTDAEGRSGQLIEFYASNDLNADGQPNEDAQPVARGFVADGQDGQDGITYVPVLTTEEDYEGQSGTWVRFYAEDDLNEANEPLPGVEPISQAFVADGEAGASGQDGEDGNSVTVTENEDGSVIVQVVDSEGDPFGEPVIIEAPESGDAGRGIESVTTNDDGDLVITYTDGETETVEIENNNGSSSVDADLSSNLSSGGVNPLWLAIPAVLGVIAALNFPAIQAAINSFAATWL